MYAAFAYLSLNNQIVICALTSARALTPAIASKTIAQVWISTTNITSFQGA